MPVLHSFIPVFIARSTLIVPPSCYRVYACCESFFCFSTCLWVCSTFTCLAFGCFSCEVLMISCFPSYKKNWCNHLYLGPPLLHVFVAHSEMWCFWKLAVWWLTSEPFHQTSGGVVKPFVDAEPWTQGSVQQQQHRGFTPPTNLMLLSNWYPLPKSCENQA